MWRQVWISQMENPELEYGEVNPAVSCGEGGRMETEENWGTWGMARGAFWRAGRQPEETFQKDPGVGGVCVCFWEKILWFVE